jgi:hypothetical protein
MLTEAEQHGNAIWDIHIRSAATKGEHVVLQNNHQQALQIMRRDDLAATVHVGLFVIYVNMHVFSCRMNLITILNAIHTYVEQATK